MTNAARQNCREKGFTLIELLIVVAIIGILAAIAVPNFLNAQTRAKIARIRADMKSLDTAMEAYYLDHNSYIPDANRADIRVFMGGFHFLTTPLAYMGAPPRDPFAKLDNVDANDQLLIILTGSTRHPNIYTPAVPLNTFMLLSWGPDRDNDNTGFTNGEYPWGNRGDGEVEYWFKRRAYETSNGLYSNGNLQIGGGQRPSGETYRTLGPVYDFLYGGQ